MSVAVADNVLTEAVIHGALLQETLTPEAALKAALAAASEASLKWYSYVASVSAGWESIIADNVNCEKMAKISPVMPVIHTEFYGYMLYLLLYAKGTTNQ